MKTKPYILLLSALGVGLVLLFKLHAAEVSVVQTTDFITIRWQGKDNSRVVRSNGKIENLNTLFRAD